MSKIDEKTALLDDYIEKFLAEHTQHQLSLNPILADTEEAQSAYANADFVIIATPTNYDIKKILLTVRLLKLLFRPSWPAVAKPLWLSNRPYQLVLQRELKLSSIQTAFFSVLNSCENLKLSMTISILLVLS